MTKAVWGRLVLGLVLTCLIGGAALAYAPALLAAQSTAVQTLAVDDDADAASASAMLRPALPTASHGVPAPIDVRLAAAAAGDDPAGPPLPLRAPLRC